MPQNSKINSLNLILYYLLVYSIYFTFDSKRNYVKLTVFYRIIFAVNRKSSGRERQRGRETTQINYLN